ncbi:MAG: hypothetical protein M1822_008093 [Bathelium mastoideum]|nr:MAG: hypothetical protein M1822_008093 [Bathelium mastoideum]
MDAVCTNRIVLMNTGLFIGFLSHTNIFIHGEWHLRGHLVIIWHIVALVALRQLFSLLHVSNILFSLSAGMASLVLFTCYCMGMFTSIAIYRIFFHRLRVFNGPPLAKVTKLWHVWHCLDRRNFLVLEKVHQKYGDFVRTGPNEISIFRPHAIELYEQEKLLKSEWYDILQPKTSAVFERDETAHSHRRRLWSQAMSVKAIQQYLPRILRQVDALTKVISDSKSTPVLVNDIMAWFSFDSMGEFMFNESFGMMTSKKMHPAIVQQKNALALLGVFAESIWIVRLGFKFAPFFGLVKEWLDMVAFCDKQMDKRIKAGAPEPDIAGWFIDEYEKPKYDIEKSVQKRRDILSGNTITAMVAGSDTTRPSLIVVWYCLALYPEHARRVYEEIRDVDVTDLSVLASLSHMNGMINEAMRLYPAQLTGSSRITTASGLRIGDVWIPPGVKVASPRFSIMRLPTAFVRPTELIPERWYSQPELILDKRAFAPFGLGYRQCIGKNLAMTEIRLVTAHLLKAFNVDFAPGYDSRIFEGDMRDQVTCQPGPLWLTFKPRT